MTKKTKHPQFSIRAAKKDWKEFQSISDAERKIYPVLFKDMIAAYKVMKSDIMSREPAQKASQTAGKASQARPTTKRGVRAGGEE